MSKQREAMELALEALQWNWGGEPLPTMEIEAIEALKRVLAEPVDPLLDAAGDLLEALEALIEDQRDASLPVLAQARAAIAKAKGEV